MKVRRKFLKTYHLLNHLTNLRLFKLFLSKKSLIKGLRKLVIFWGNSILFYIF